ncbi:putative protein phosphatase 2C 76 isoform X2 [Gossypium australe]|uniref:Uncharacterized protein n=1 Tax=Gossypium australe TaxID=47621 RepID=A0A5B6VMW1_9ROSI|nr:putative protein phosphatase 2C 76 isoform X2 [Gossypium australe]
MHEECHVATSPPRCQPTISLLLSSNLLSFLFTFLPIGFPVPEKTPRYAVRPYSSPFLIGILHVFQPGSDPVLLSGVIDQRKNINLEKGAFIRFLKEFICLCWINVFLKL